MNIQEIPGQPRSLQLLKSFQLLSSSPQVPEAYFAFAASAAPIRATDFLVLHHRSLQRLSSCQLPLNLPLASSRDTFLGPGDGLMIVGKLLLSALVLCQCAESSWCFATHSINVHSKKTYIVDRKSKNNLVQRAPVLLEKLRAKPLRPKMSVQIKVVVSEDELREALEIRKRVFIEEQKVPECDEIDEFDASPSAAVHFLASKDGMPAATARVRFLDDGRRAKFQRVATLAKFRKQGIGHALMQHAAAHVRAHHAPPVQELYLEAQVHAVGFYERLGFEPYGDEFLDVGIPHRAMRLAA